MSDEPKATADARVDPFAPENVGAVQLIVLMRCYDALMALLQVADEDQHNALNKIHEEGGIAWSLPWINLSEEGGEEDGL